MYCTRDSTVRTYATSRIRNEIIKARGGPRGTMGHWLRTLHVHEVAERQGARISSPSNQGGARPSDEREVPLWVEERREKRPRRGFVPPREAAKLHLLLWGRSPYVPRPKVFCMRYLYVAHDSNQRIQTRDWPIGAIARNVSSSRMEHSIPTYITFFAHILVNTGAARNFLQSSPLETLQTHSRCYAKNDVIHLDHHTAYSVAGHTCLR